MAYRTSWRVCVPTCFFFRAEDGIRDVAVTGVQTCALPILGRLQRAQRLLVVPQTQVDKCDGESCVAGRAALERRQDTLRLGALAGAPGYVPEDPREVGRVASQSRHLSSLRQRLGVAPLPGER